MIPAKQRVVFIVELAAIILSRVVVLAMPFGLVGEVASSNPWWIASAMLLLLFIGPLLGNGTVDLFIRVFGSRSPRCTANLCGYIGV